MAKDNIIDLGGGYEINDDEKIFFEDAEKKREYFEEGEENSYDFGEDDSDGYDLGEDAFDDFEYVDGEGDSDEEEEDNQSEYEKTSKTDKETFVMWWKILDDTRAGLLSAWFGVNKEEMLFYPDIEEEGNNEMIKKSGAIVVRKYSNLIFFSHAPEMILLGAILISTGVLYFRAKTMKKEKRKKSKNMNASHQKSSKKESTKKDEKFGEYIAYEVVKTG